MQRFLKDADSKQDEDQAIRNLVAEIREVTYGAENLISAFLFQVDEPTRRTCLRHFLTRSVCIFGEVKDRHNNIRSEISTIIREIRRLTVVLRSHGIIDTAEAVVSSAAKWIVDLLIQEAKLLYGVRGQVEDLLRELRQMQCFLKDADAKKDQNQAIRYLVSEIRGVACQAENVISAFLFQVDKPTRGTGLRHFLTRTVCIFGEVKDWPNISSDISTIIREIRRLTVDLQSHGIIAITQEIQGSSSTAQSRTEVRLDEDFVGFEEDISILLSHLVGQEARNHRFVSICGVGGLGKTTLARKLYDHKDVRSHFEAFAWFPYPDKSGTSTEHQLLKQLYKVHQEKKCLVVLDDIWSLDAWKSLSPGFTMGNKDSKVILTTCNKDLAAFGNVFLHEPERLSAKDGWKLLKKKAFPNADFTDFKIDERLKWLGPKMAGICRGLPLAIVLLGGLLSTKQTFHEWIVVHDSYIERNLKRGKFMGEENDDVSDVISLSYQELPYQLKSCFHFLGIYPEDFEIEVEPLYQMWMADCIVSKEERRDKETLMDVAERFLGELAQRCMFQVELEPEEEYSPFRGSRRIKYCRLHDLMRDLSLSKGKEENFLEVIDLQHNTTEEAQASYSYMETPNFSRKIPRVAIYQNKNSDCHLIEEEEQRAKHIRAVSFFSGDEFNNSTGKELAGLSHNSKFLRVINFDRSWSEIGGSYWPEKLQIEIGNLILLRYLGLRGTGVKMLPSSIANLRHLQTLDLRTDNIISIPNVLWKMKRLVHLYFPRYNLFTTEGGVLLRLNGLTKLETIQNLASDKVDIRDLFELTNLQRLKAVRIMDKPEDLETVYRYLANSEHQLHYTSIYISSDFLAKEGLSLLRNLVSYRFLVSLDINGMISKLPKFVNFGLGLASLTLWNSLLNEDPMATLENLPNLRSLELLDAFVGKEMICSAHGFPHLRRLHLWKFRKLEEWSVHDGAMPNLSYLQIHSCKKLKMFPDGLRFIATLQELQIWGMPKAFEDRLRVVDGEEGEDFHKIRHIHSIQFQSTNEFNK